MAKTICAKGILSESTHRCAAEDLEKILADVPLRILASDDCQLRARMGQGKFISIRPIEGEINSVSIGRVTLFRDPSTCPGKYLLFDNQSFGDYVLLRYKENNFMIKYI